MRWDETLTCGIITEIWHKSHYFWLAQVKWNGERWDKDENIAKKTKKLRNTYIKWNWRAQRSKPGKKWENSSLCNVRDCYRTSLTKHRQTLLLRNAKYERLLISISFQVLNNIIFCITHTHWKWWRQAKQWCFCLPDE